MNVNTLNSNNNVFDSVVLPPRMADVSFWVTPDHTTFDASGLVSDMYDLSGRGNHLAQGDAAEKPTVGVTAGQFNGRRVIKFEHSGSDIKHLEHTTMDLQNVFGTSVSATVDPEFTIAMVVNETANSAGPEIYFSLEENTTSDPDKVYLYRHRQGAAFRVNGDDAQFDTSQLEFTAGTAVTSIATLSDIGSSMEFHAWIGGTACDWDDADIGVNYPCDPNNLMSPLTGYTLTLGCDRQQGNEWYGEVAECIVWKGEHSAAERTETLNYLRDKWGCN